MVHPDVRAQVVGEICTSVVVYVNKSYIVSNGRKRWYFLSTPRSVSKKSMPFFPIGYCFTIRLQKINGEKFQVCCG